MRSFLRKVTAPMLCSTSRAVHPQRLTSKTAFAKKATPQQDGDYRFFAARSGHREPHRAHGEINWTLQYHSLAEGEVASHAQARPAVCCIA
jgi:hypothetical protein